MTVATTGLMTLAIDAYEDRRQSAPLGGRTLQVNWDSQSPSLLPALVCYADILGFSAMTEHAFKSGKGNEFLQRIKASVATAYERVREFATLVGVDPPIFEMKVFSDNIVAAHPLHNVDRDGGEPELGRLLDLFAYVQAILAADGFFLRGAISSGQHYQDQDLVYGDAFLEAATLDKSSTPPRLVIGPSVEPLILEHLSYYYDGVTPHHRYLLEDPGDGRLFLNYLNWVFDFFPPGPINHNLLAEHREKVSENLHRYASNEKILKKYIWLATYHNYVCHTFAEQHYTRGDIGADPEELAIAAHARRTLDHLIDFEAPPEVQPPRPLDKERLRQRVDTAGHTPR